MARGPSIGRKEGKGRPSTLSSSPRMRKQDRTPGHQAQRAGGDTVRTTTRIVPTFPWISSELLVQGHPLDIQNRHGQTIVVILLLERASRWAHGLPGSVF